MSYAALLSGITLANAGLGIVHGLASPMGGYTEIPHGVACGTIVAIATQLTINNRLRRDPDKNQAYLEKYAKIGRLLANDKCGRTEACCDFLIEKLQEWTKTLRLPHLKKYGFGQELIAKIAAETDNKNNPVKLERDEIEAILLDRL